MPVSITATPTPSPVVLGRTPSAPTVWLKELPSFVTSRALAAAVVATRRLIVSARTLRLRPRRRASAARRRADAALMIGSDTPGRPRYARIVARAVASLTPFLNWTMASTRLAPDAPSRIVTPADAGAAGIRANTVARTPQRIRGRTWPPARGKREWDRNILLATSMVCE